MGEVAAPRGVEIAQQREAFRAFMTARHLRPTEWARAAGVPPGEILGFLTAKTRHIAPETLEKLAQAARCEGRRLFPVKRKGGPTDRLFIPENQVLQKVTQTPPRPQ